MMFPLNSYSLLAVLLMLVYSLPVQAEAYFDHYDFAAKDRFIDLGVQPNAYPLAFISAVMQHDKILRADLHKKGFRLRAQPFKKGNDIYRLLGNGKLDMAFLGDMPTVNAIVTTPTVVIGLGKRNFSSVVSRDYSRIEELRDKKVAYSPGSSSHLVLMRALEASGMSEKDVKLVALEPELMPDALEDGSIMAYSAWEPVPSISFERNPRNKAIYRGMSTDWVVFSRDFAEREPEVAILLVASYVRSINWMRNQSSNLDKAAGWVLGESEKFTGKMTTLSKQKVMDIARKDLLDVPGAPSTPTQLDGAPPLMREFAFIKAQGKLAVGIDEGVIGKAFSYTGLKRVQSDPKRYRLNQFEYD
jgi:ABC-type nitrate/sulfonate/bicarbonate transport system substrate-binding protein